MVATDTYLILAFTFSRLDIQIGRSTPLAQAPKCAGIPREPSTDALFPSCSVRYTGLPLREVALHARPAGRGPQTDHAPWRRRLRALKGFDTRNTELS